MISGAGTSSGFSAGAASGGPREGPRRGGGVGKRSLLALALVAAGGTFLAAARHQRLGAEELLAREQRLAAEEVDRIAAARTVYRDEPLPAWTTFSQFLASQGLAAATIDRLLQDARPVYDLGRVRAGNRATIVSSGTGELRAVRYQVDADRELWIAREGDRFRAAMQSIPYELTVAGVAGRVENSLFEALADQGERDQLALEIADIFGWDIDFSTDPRRGDTFEVLVEKKMLHGEFYGYGRVLAAAYRNEGKQHQAVLFRDPSGRPAYYAPDGKSLQKAFLRSPLKFSARVSSRFSHSRFHPILKRYRPHLGVDYAVPVGSPVQAVAHGRVISAGWKGDGGKEIRLQHARGYETYYLHLSRILVRPGQRVSQGQVIGLSGATGLATGPHLDFRVRQNGQFRNFLAMKLPPDQAVSRADREEFDQLVAQRLETLTALAERQAPPPEQASLAPPPHASGQGR
jgi:murein DD-endopeptidase MepM/ murein hydrolase activator NlpD